MNNRYVLLAIILVIFTGLDYPESEVVRTTIPQEDFKKGAVYMTALGTDLRLGFTDSVAFVPGRQPLETEMSIFVNTSKAFQEIVGIGGAITDASAEVFAKLPADKQQELIQAYYSEAGINYSLLRTPIHSCDFSSASFTYVEEGDQTLSSFGISHDLEYRIPMIKRALAAGNEIITYASPWSPPAYMKTNGSMLQGGKLKPEYYGLWAQYYVKFIEAYEALDIPIWGLTIQNEPMATQRWESCIYTAEDERDFLKNHLGPTLANSGMGDKKIIVWDHNRDLITRRANVILGDPEAAKYVWGTGFHWYETWTGSQPKFDNLGAVKASFPDKALMFTEGCNEKFDYEQLQRWTNAERYGRSMINDFNMGTAGWTDWNILLDEKGGPNHVGNYCFAPIHADTRTGELIYTPSYFFIGHFSKYLKKGARRISTAVSRSFLLATSFQNPDGTSMTVIMNEHDEPYNINLFVDDQMTALTIPPRSMSTIIF